MPDEVHFCHSLERMVIDRGRIIWRAVQLIDLPQEAMRHIFTYLTPKPPSDVHAVEINWLGIEAIAPANGEVFALVVFPSLRRHMNRTYSCASMSKRKPFFSRFNGYRVPVRIEALGERDFKKILAMEEEGLMMIGEQIPIFDGPERLDLLAIDPQGVLWIFEFKRDIASPAAVGQLLTYGSYVSGLGYDELDGFFSKSKAAKGGKITLKEAFKTFFNLEILDLPRQVRLVLVAFDFSKSCDRLLSFLDHASTITIGKLKMEWVCSVEGPEERRFEYQQTPHAIQGMTFEHAQKTFFVLSTEIESFVWEWCRRSDLLFLPDLQDLADTGEYSPYSENSQEQPFHVLPKSLPYQALKSNTVLFVYANNCICWESPDGSYHPMQHPPEGVDHKDWEAFRVRGLLGVGVIRNAPRQVARRDLPAWRRRLNWPNGDFENIFARFPWVLHIEWTKTVQSEHAVDVPNASLETSLREVETETQVNNHLKALRADKLRFLDCWF
jgi:hypothetical protein